MVYFAGFRSSRGVLQGFYEGFGLKLQGIDSAAFHA